MTKYHIMGHLSLPCTLLYSSDFGFAGVHRLSPFPVPHIRRIEVSSTVHFIPKKITDFFKFIMSFGPGGFVHPGSSKNIEVKRNGREPMGVMVDARNLIEGSVFASPAFNAGVTSKSEWVGWRVQEVNGVPLPLPTSAECEDWTSNRIDAVATETNPHPSLPARVTLKVVKLGGSNHTLPRRSAPSTATATSTPQRRRSSEKKEDPTPRLKTKNSSKILKRKTTKNDETKEKEVKSKKKVKSAVKQATPEAVSTEPATLTTFTSAGSAEEKHKVLQDVADQLLGSVVLSPTSSVTSVSLLEETPSRPGTSPGQRTSPVPTMRLEDEHDSAPIPTMLRQIVTKKKELEAFFALQKGAAVRINLENKQRVCEAAEEVDELLRELQSVEENTKRGSKKKLLLMEAYIALRERILHVEEENDAVATQAKHDAHYTALNREERIAERSMVAGTSHRQSKRASAVEHGLETLAENFSKLGNQDDEGSDDAVDEDSFSPSDVTRTGRYFTAVHDLAKIEGLISAIALLGETLASSTEDDPPLDASVTSTAPTRRKSLSESTLKTSKFRYLAPQPYQFRTDPIWSSDRSGFWSAHPTVPSKTTESVMPLKINWYLHPDGLYHENATAREEAAEAIDRLSIDTVGLMSGLKQQLSEASTRNLCTIATTLCDSIREDEDDAPPTAPSGRPHVVIIEDESWDSASSSGSPSSHVDRAVNRRGTLPLEAADLEAVVQAREQGQIKKHIARRQQHYKQPSPRRGVQRQRDGGSPLTDYSGRRPTIPMEVDLKFKAKEKEVKETEEDDEEDEHIEDTPLPTTATTPPHIVRKDSKTKRLSLLKKSSSDQAQTPPWQRPIGKIKGYGASTCKPTQTPPISPSQRDKDKDHDRSKEYIAKSKTNTTTTTTQNHTAKNTVCGSPRKKNVALMGLEPEVEVETKKTVLLSPIRLSGALRRLSFPGGDEVEPFRAGPLPPIPSPALSHDESLGDDHSEISQISAASSPAHFVKKDVDPFTFFHALKEETPPKGVARRRSSIDGVRRGSLFGSKERRKTVKLEGGSLLGPITMGDRRKSAVV